VKKIMAYKRPDGSVGVRNKVLVLPSVVCAAETARMIAMQVQGTVALQNHLGCGQIGRDARMTIDTLVGLGKNPNVFAVLVVGLGCESARPKEVAASIAESGKPVECVVIQEAGGSLNAVNQGVRLAMDLVARASLEQRVSCDVSDLVVAVECGGSDPTSGVAANPSVGSACDRVVADGGTVILSETTELIGAEHILAARAESPEVGKQLCSICSRMERRAMDMGTSLRGGNPSPGNIAGGLTTLEEKSLGCVHKAGSSVLREVLPYGAAPTKKGLVMMDTPGFDVDSVTGMVAGGAQLCVFTTGLGTPVGNPIAPVIKVTGNPSTFAKMRDNMDINAGVILEEDATIEDMGAAIYEEILAVSGGKQTRSEILGYCESSFWRCGTCV
jgi:altronate dehydratase large subunit